MLDPRGRAIVSKELRCEAPASLWRLNDMTTGQLVRVPCHYDIWMRGETMAHFVNSFMYNGRMVALLRGARCRKLFKVWLDELTLAQV